MGSYVNSQSSSPPQIDAFVHFDGKLIASPMLSKLCSRSVSRNNVIKSWTKTDRTGGSRRNLNEPNIETLLSLSKNSAHSMPDLRHLFVSEAKNSNHLDHNSQGGLKKSESELAPPPQDNASGYRLIKSPKPPGTESEGLWGHPSPEPGHMSQGFSGIESMLSLDFGAPAGTSGGDKTHHYALNGSSKLNMGLSKQGNRLLDQRSWI